MSYGARPALSVLLGTSLLIATSGAIAGGCASLGGAPPQSSLVDDAPPDELQAVGVSTVAPAARPPSLAEHFADDDRSALTDFRQILAPYGRWAEDERLGSVWVPDRAVVGDAFVPYLTAGRWALSEAEAYVWVSEHDERFGWVVFRYGRWGQSSELGWVWVPGRTYAPAWVVWRVGAPGEPFVGWGPAPPSFIWRDGAPVRLDEEPLTLVGICKLADLFDVDVTSRFLPTEQARAALSQLVDFDARFADGYARPRPYVASAIALPARGPGLSTGHFSPEAWPAERHSRAETPNARLASPAAMGRSSGVMATSARTPGASLRTFVAGGAEVRTASGRRPMQSASLYVPIYSGSSDTQRPPPEPLDDTAAAPSSTALVPVVIPPLRGGRGPLLPRGPSR